MIQISDNTQQIQPSKIRKMFNKALEYDHVISFTLGEPDFTASPNVVEAGCRAIREGKTKYSENAGLLALRQAIAEYFHRTEGLSYDPASQIVVTPGAMGALFLALKVLLNPGDEVIVNEPCWTNYVQQIRMCGGVPVSVKTNAQRGFDLDVSAIAEAVTDKTKAIIPVDIGGVPCDYDRLFTIVNDAKSLFVPSNDIQRALGRIPIVADCAHSFGATYKGLHTGNVADFSSFSFHAVKNFTTAEGGCATWNHIEGIDDEALYKEFQLLSLHGQDKDALAKTKMGAWEYDIKGTYYKCNMTDIMAAIGLAQLERYPGLLERRREIIDRYNDAFKDCPVSVVPHYTDEHMSSGHLYLVRINDATIEQRNELIERMAEKGVATNVHYKPIPMHTAYKNLGFSIDDYPNAYKQFKNEITLPLHTNLTDEEVDYVIDTFKECLGAL